MTEDEGVKSGVLKTEECVVRNFARPARFAQIQSVDEREAGEFGAKVDLAERVDDEVSHGDQVAEDSAREVLHIHPTVVGERKPLHRRERREDPCGKRGVQQLQLVGVEVQLRQRSHSRQGGGLQPLQAIVVELKAPKPDQGTERVVAQLRSQGVVTDVQGGQIGETPERVRRQRGEVVAVQSQRAKAAQSQEGVVVHSRQPVVVQQQGVQRRRAVEGVAADRMQLVVAEVHTPQP